MAREEVDVYGPLDLSVHDSLPRIRSEFLVGGFFNPLRPKRVTIFQETLTVSLLGAFIGDPDLLKKEPFLLI